MLRSFSLPPYPQDCVQLNQYKLQSEIGKVGLGQAVGGSLLRLCGGSLSGSPGKCEVEPERPQLRSEESFVL